MAILAAISISACSSSSNSSTNSTDNSATTTSTAADNSASTADNGAASSDNSAAAAPGAGNDIPVYPGAKTDTPPGASGTPPPGVAGYSTTDGVDKVTAWYKANFTGAKVLSSSATGAMLQAGDNKTGSAVMIQAAGGKTYIVTGTASAMAH